jgi:hypothetical protein
MIKFHPRSHGRKRCGNARAHSESQVILVIHAKRVQRLCEKRSVTSAVKVYQRRPREYSRRLRCGLNRRRANNTWYVAQRLACGDEHPQLIAGKLERARSNSATCESHDVECRVPKPHTTSVSDARTYREFVCLFVCLCTCALVCVLVCVRARPRVCVCVYVCVHEQRAFHVCRMM